MPHKVCFALLLARIAVAQVVSPPEIRDLQLRELQEQHLVGLRRAAAEIGEHRFPYPLYLSRKLNLSEEQQRKSDQRSIRFDRFRGQTVLEITGNYYAAYSAGKIAQEERAQRTLKDVITPLLSAVVPPLAAEKRIQAFAVEISHHVRRKVLGVDAENNENVAFVLPAAAARQFAVAATPAEQEAILWQGSLYVNQQPLDGWGESRAITSSRLTPLSPLPKASPEPPAPAPPPVSTETLKSLQAAQQAGLDRLARELDSQLHLVAYAAPAFIEFRGAAYLQLSMRTALPESAAVSQYQLAALAFDRHISHVIRPVLAVLEDHPAFEGIDFSTSVRLSGAPEGTATSIEFFFSAANLNRYRRFDLTGQELINSGFVLINGERVSLDLQGAEAGAALRTSLP